MNLKTNMYPHGIPIQDCKYFIYRSGWKIVNRFEEFRSDSAGDPSLFLDKQMTKIEKFL